MVKHTYDVAVYCLADGEAAGYDVAVYCLTDGEAARYDASGFFLSASTAVKFDEAVCLVLLDGEAIRAVINCRAASYLWSRCRFKKRFRLLPLSI
jgi:hypothetical protein